MAEQRPFKPKRAGSTPAAPTTSRPVWIEVVVQVGRMLGVLFVLAVVVAALALFGPVVE